MIAVVGRTSGVNMGKERPAIRRLFGIGAMRALIVGVAISQVQAAGAVTSSPAPVVTVLSPSSGFAGDATVVFIPSSAHRRRRLEQTRGRNGGVRRGRLGSWCRWWDLRRTVLRIYGSARTHRSWGWPLLRNRRLPGRTDHTGVVMLGTRIASRDPKSGVESSRRA